MNQYFDIDTEFDAVEFAADVADVSSYTGDDAYIGRGTSSARRYDGLDVLADGALEILVDELFDEFGVEVSEDLEGGEELADVEFDFTPEAELHCGYTRRELHIIMGAEPKVSERVSKAAHRATTRKVVAAYAEAKAETERRAAKRAKNKARRTAAKARKAEVQAAEAAAKAKARNTIKVVKHAEPVVGPKAKASYMAALKRGDQLVELAARGDHGKATTSSTREFTRGKKTISLTTHRSFEW